MINISNALPIKGWMSQKELEWLATTALKSKVIVEFGCFHGRSTRALGDNCPGIVYAVDPWNGAYIKDDGSILEGFDTAVFDLFLYNLQDLILGGRVKAIQDYSNNFREPIQADFVFIDGDHRFHSVISDINTAKRIARKGAIIAGHDYTHKDWPGVKRAVDMIYPNAKKYESIWWVLNE